MRDHFTKAQPIFRETYRGAALNYIRKKDNINKHIEYTLLAINSLSNFSKLQ